MHVNTTGWVLQIPEESTYLTSKEIFSTNKKYIYPLLLDQGLWNWSDAVFSNG